MVMHLEKPVIESQVTAIIDAGCEFEGKLCFYGTVRIGGVFRGSIYTPDTLIIGEGASIEAEIDAGVIIINGEVRGNLRAKYRIEIHSPAKVRGSLVTPSLSVDAGVIFEGSSQMLPFTSQEEGTVQAIEMT